MYLFFDTETTGLPQNYRAPASDTANWPRLVQLACLLYDEKGKLVEGKDYIVKPNGFTIPAEASKIHRITTQKAIDEGIELAIVLNEFEELLDKSKHLVAHNMEFDEKILGAEFHRIIGTNPLDNKKRYCTMKDPKVISYCEIPPFRYGSYKWPKLSELHHKLFGEYFDEAHDASVDINATAKSFWELKEIGVI